MVKTYRALGVVAIVTLLCVVLEAILDHEPGRTLAISEFGWFNVYELSFWSLTFRMLAPMIGTFSVLVAWQSRQWAWLVIFILTGIIGVFGVTLLGFLPLPVGFPLPVSGAIQLPVNGASQPPDLYLLVITVATNVVPLAIPALAALVFAWLNLRNRSPAQDA